MYEYKFKTTRVVDGDTVDGSIDLGFNVSIQVRVRLEGIDTPETRTRNKAEKVYGLQAKVKLKEILKIDKIIIQSHGVGKFGRVLGRLYLVNGTDVNRQLIDEGYAIPYQGDKKITPEEMIAHLDIVREKNA
jgi:micrococcal nuclease